MPDSNYTSEPPVATAGQLLAISDSIGQLRQEMRQEMGKLADVPQKIDRMSMQFDQMQEKQQQFAEDLDKTKANSSNDIKAISDEVKQGRKEIEIELRSLNESRTKIDTIGRLVNYGGLALVGALFTLWQTQTAKVETVGAQASSNVQRINVVEKQQEQAIRIQDEMRMELYKKHSQ